MHDSTLSAQVQHLLLANRFSGKCEAHVRADIPNGLSYLPPIEGSALLDLRELKVLGVAGWHIYFGPTAAASNGSGLAELALTELHISTWQHEPHDLLSAALRGGAECLPANCRILRFNRRPKNGHACM